MDPNQQVEETRQTRQPRLWIPITALANMKATIQKHISLPMNSQGETISEFQREPYWSAAVDKKDQCALDSTWFPWEILAMFLSTGLLAAGWEMGKTNLDFRVAARVGVKLTVLVGKSLVDLDFRCREYIVVRSKQNRTRVWRDLYSLPCQHTTPRHSLASIATLAHQSHTQYKYRVR